MGQPDIIKLKPDYPFYAKVGCPAQNIFRVLQKNQIVQISNKAHKESEHLEKIPGIQDIPENPGNLNYVISCFC